MGALPFDELFAIFSRVAVGSGPPADATAEAGAAARAPLAQVVTAALAAHPHFAADEGRFVAHVGRHVPADPAGWAAALAQIHAADLYLAFACAEQAPGALATFESACRPAIEGALRGEATEGFADDARQVMRERLFIGDPTDQAAPGPRILLYAGRGPLAAWVAVSARRTALSLRRHEVARQARDLAAAREDLATAVHPELAYLKRAYRAAFAESFAAAFAGLTDRERAVMRLHLLSRLRMDQIAPMFHVDTSTISRWLASARDSLLARTREGLTGRLHVSPGELESMAHLLTSQIDVSLAQLLADKPSKQ